MQILHYLWAAATWAFVVFWIWMLVDCIKNEDDSAERVTWALFMFFLAPLFAPIYFFRRYRPRKKEKTNYKNAA